MVKTFLKALEQRLDRPEGFFIVKETTLPTVFQSYKEYTLDVYYKEQNRLENVAHVSASDKNSNLETLKEKVAVKVIEEILKRYGI